MSCTSPVRWFGFGLLPFLLAACGPDGYLGAGDATAQMRVVFDCADPEQRLTCDDDIVCHATGSRTSPFVSVPATRVPGPRGTRPASPMARTGWRIKSPGASALDVGSGSGLDCECEPRICDGVCTGADAGTACDDGDPCTDDGACDGDDCASGPPSCTADAPLGDCAIQTGECDAGTGECFTDPAPAGTPCGVDMTCTATGACVLPVKVNEVESSGGVPGDWVELHNTGELAADVSGYVFKDSDDTHGYVLPEGTTIAPGGFLAVDEAAFGFGLGSTDSARLYDTEGALVDSHAWVGHAVTTFGRCPDGSGAFALTTNTTKGTANDCAIAVVINEIESSGGSPGDWVELYNPALITFDLSGWVFRDSDLTHAYVIPAGTQLAAGGYLLLEEAAFGFGLGSNDSANLFLADGTAVSAHAWTVHAETTYARCPNGTGAITTSTLGTKGATNACGVGGPSTGPWPGSGAVGTVDGAGAFGGNLSDLFYEPVVLWGVRNDPSTLFRLVWDGAIWTPDAANGWDTGKNLHYTNGLGRPDGEGVTGAEAGSTAIYVASERDGDADGVSRNSILRYDTADTGTELTATHEWDLTARLPATGPNVGVEALTWVPDSFLVANGFFDETAGAVYDPLDYPDHGSGLFFVGVEATGDIFAYALNHTTGASDRIATIDSGLSAVRGAYFDRDVGYLWTQCGSGCANTHGVMAIDTALASPTRGRFSVLTELGRPASMANIGNEGLAVAPESECVAGFKGFFWADDGETDGHAIRYDTIPCGTFVP